jgi:nicotinate-nucleotide adenylyltransferase
VVAPDPWQKSGAVVASADDRLALVEALVADLPGHEASAMEFERSGPTYTVDTLIAVSEQHPGTELHLIVGEDVARTLDTWHRPDEVRRLAQLVVIDRPEGDVSSSEIRRRIGSGQPVEHLTPPAVIREIRERGLYPRS